MPGPMMLAAREPSDKAHVAERLWSLGFDTRVMLQHS